MPNYYCDFISNNCSFYLDLSEKRRHQVSARYARRLGQTEIVRKRIEEARLAAQWEDFYACKYPDEVPF